MRVGFPPDITIVKLSGLRCRKKDRHKEKEIIWEEGKRGKGRGVNSAGEKEGKKKQKRGKIKKEGNHCWLSAKLWLLSRFE